MNLFVLIGGLIGLSFGKLPGLIAGALFGYIAYRAFGRNLANNAIARIRRQFLESTFSVMGAICKADGRVTPDEIRMAESLFDRLQLDEASRDTAKRAFNRGKAPAFDLDDEVARFMALTRGQPMLRQVFIQIQLSAIAADGVMVDAEHRMLIRIARGLGLSDADIAQLEALLRGATSRSANRSQQLADAYQVLGVTPGASDAEIKKAYRRLMSLNHPDKLAAHGLPDSMRPIAEEKSRQITLAYETVERARRR